MGRCSGAILQNICGISSVKEVMIDGGRTPGVKGLPAYWLRLSKDGLVKSKVIRFLAKEYKKIVKIADVE